jgi:mRNA interferase RelE/StbE
MPDYSVSFRRSAEKDMRKLASRIQDRVIEAVEKLAKAPRPLGCKKLSGSENAYRIRIGEYRVIYTVDDVILIVAIERVRHRREIYR